MAIPVILRGETAKPITLRLADGYDYAGCTLAVDFCGVVRSFGGLAPGGTLSLAFTDGETAGFPLGTSKAFLTLRNGNGDTCRLPWAKIKVTDSPDELRDAATSIDVDPATFVGEILPARFTDEDVRSRLNAIINWMKRGAVGVLLALALPAFADALTVHTAPKGAIYNDEQVVTNVTLDASGLATKGEVPGTVSNIVTKTYVEELGISGGGAEVAINNVTNNAFKIEVRGNPGSVGYTNATTNEEARVKIGTLTVYAGNSADIQVAQADEAIEWPKTGNPPSNYDLYAPSETDPTVPAWAKSENPPVMSLEPAMNFTRFAASSATNYTDSVVSNIASDVGIMWQYVWGETAWIAVTNYMRTISGVTQSLQLWEVRDGVTNLVYSSSEEITNLCHSLIHDCKTNLEHTVETATNDMPSKAWSRYQSASGAENPAPGEITIVSTPQVMFTGGGEWTRYVNTGGSAIWILKSNGINTFGGGVEGGEGPEGSFFEITDDEGNSVFSIRRTDSYEVDAISSGVYWDGDKNFCVEYNATNNCPTLFAATNLAYSVAEVAGEIDSLGITVSWQKNAAGRWCATIHQDVPRTTLFVHAKVTQEGSVAVVNSAPTRLDGGVMLPNDPKRYTLSKATINGQTVLVLTEVAQ